MSFKLNTEHITIETINICNANCVFCPREKYNLEPEIMTVKLWRKIIDELATHNYEHLKIDTQGFGEPFLDPHFFERLKYARKKIPCSTFFTSSNCTKMTKDKIPLICEYIDALRTSFYAMTKETYNKTQRGNAVFEDALYNILDFIRYRDYSVENIAGKKPWLIMQMEVVPGYNDHEVEAWREFWEPRADEIMIWSLHNFGGLRRYRKIDHAKQVSCGRPVYGPAYVHTDGIVSMCCWDINERLVLGDLNTQTLEEIFHDKPYKMIHEKHESRDFRGLYCYHCEQTCPDPKCLIYSNKNRKLCTMTSDHLDFNTGEYKKEEKK
jgi:MoaA/NifB/PqqE/SkfB family radical SAM enzyme